MLLFKKKFISNFKILRVLLDAKPDLLSHFSELARQNELPSFETLLSQAHILVNRYASQDAHEQALSHAESSDATASMKVPFSPPQNTNNTLSTRTDSDIQVSESDRLTLPTEDIPKVHQEADDFNGDRVLANTILFLQDFGWWIEIVYAVPEGDIGRVFEILKVHSKESDSHYSLLKMVGFVGSDRSGYLPLLDRLTRTTQPIFWRCTVYCTTKLRMTFAMEYSTTGL